MASGSKTSSPEEAATNAALVAAGKPEATVEVSIGPRFLELFSEQLYTSPNKAFEELVSNSWDAGASVVHIGIPDDLSVAEAALWVLDDGVSMDLAGLELLWAVADDHKTQPDWEQPAGREQIGKFGIGKLATYVLANEVTYVCRDASGDVRAVTVDYREIKKRGAGDGDGNALHVSPVPFPVRKLEQSELAALLESLDSALPALITNEGVEVYGGDPDEEDPEQREYHDAVGERPEPSSTWTLVALTSLKDRGRQVSKGTVRRVLRAALPLGETIAILVDGDHIRPSKIEVPRLGTFVLGQDFSPTSIPPESRRGRQETDEEDDPNGQESFTAEAVMTEDGRPGLQVEHLGLVTGEIKIYERSIQTGRSAERARSNGFFVNVLGRVVNLHEERFGLPALSHGVWAKLRITFRADGLNPALSVSREAVEENLDVDAMRSLLRAAFNYARTFYDDNATWPSLNEILTDEWGTVPLTPLLNAVDRALEEDFDPTLFIDLGGVEDADAARAALLEQIGSRPTETLREVKAEPSGQDAPLARYELGGHRIVVNSEHPFYVEQVKGPHDAPEIVQTGALVALLTDAYLLELGVSWDDLAEAQRYRDNVERLIARARRRSAPMLAHMLSEATTDSRALEQLVADCLASLGFGIQHQAQRGKPEGIATADLAPGQGGEPRRYRFVYEAKSTQKASMRVSAKDVNVSGQDRHRRLAAADTDDPNEVAYALVIAPGFESGALEEECEELNVCPMRTDDLARLLMGVAATGPLNLSKFRDVLAKTDPDDVALAIDELITEARGHLGITMQDLVAALQGFDNIDQISTGVIAERMRRERGDQGDQRPKEPEVQALIQGLEMLVPSAIQMVGRDRLVLGTTPERLAEAVRVQAARLPDAHRFDLDQIPPMVLVNKE